MIPREAFTIEKKIPFEPVAKKPESRHLTTLIMKNKFRLEKKKRSGKSLLRNHVKMTHKGVE